MEDLKQEIRDSLDKALKEGDGIARSTLGLLLAAISNREKEKRYKISKEESGLSEEKLTEKSILSNEELLEIISSEAKKRKEAILGYEKGGREDSVKKEKAELEILEKYLPEQLSEEEIKKMVKEIIEKSGTSEMKDMGKVMSEIMPKVKGRADGNLVSGIVKKLLSKAE